MNALEQFYIDLDQSNWDVKQERDINQALIDLEKKLSEEGNIEVLHLAEIDRKAFHFSKLPERGLSFRAEETRKMEDGSEIPFEWPDIREFKKEDFDYLYNRFKTCKNTYAKTEYGLVLSYSNNKQDNNFIIELLNTLFNLLKTYIEKARQKEDKDRYTLYLTTVLANALHIANNRKRVPEVEVIFKALIEYTFEVHQSWDVTHRLSLRAIIDFTNFAVQYSKDFKQIVQIDKFIDKNWEAAKFLSIKFMWGAIYIADISMRLCWKLGTDMKDWLYFKAEQYEKLSTEKKDNQNSASVRFVEKAMSIYKSLKDEENLIRLQKEYQRLRTEFKPGEVKTEMPQNETQRIIELIRKEVKEKSEEDIIKTLLLTPMIMPLDKIKKLSEESFKESMLLNMLPNEIEIKDEFGNTIAQYITDEERNKFSLLNTYEFQMQIATQTIMQYFVEAFRAEKISVNGIVSLLNQTWMGEEASRRSNGRNINFSYIKLVESGINSFFRELLQWKTDANYYPNFVSATDSLVLKAEYFLREYCYFLGTATFKSKENNIIMERTLDDILDDKKIKDALTEDDHFFIKFILTEKAGYNLRNRIAHGLMDNVDYGLQYPILAILIILKLSNYQFIQIKNN